MESVNGGFPVAEAANAFALQTETLTLDPYLSDAQGETLNAFLTSVYQNLFSRTPDAAGCRSGPWRSKVVYHWARQFRALLTAPSAMMLPR